MGLPVAFLIGLIVVFGAREIAAPIAGSAEPARLFEAALVLAVPSLLALLARWLLRYRIRAGRRPGRLPSVLLRLSISASPLAVLLICTYGGWLDFVWQWGGDSDLASLFLLVVPLFAVELPRMVLATQVAVWTEVGHEILYDVVRDPGSKRPELPNLQELSPVIRLRLGWVLLVTLPWLFLGLGLDLLRLSRELYTFVLGTSLGLTLGFGVLLLLAALALPIWFRIAFGTHPNLPEPLGTELRATAAALGFAPSRVLLMPTGMTAVNAMMVGPLGVSRCLCVTDGLIRMLDSDALSGVVAHEVGHARMGHPGLLMLLAVILPLLLMQPMSLLPLDEIDPFWQVPAAVAAVSLIWLLVRALAQRFELEADIASVRALGAGPCSRALQAVSHGTFPVRRHLMARLATLHPEESIRLATMMRYEQEPQFRARFDATGRRLRIAILGAVAVAAIVAIAVWIADWRYERTIWRFQTGDVVTASQLFEATAEPVPERWQETWELLDAELRSAAAIAPEATDWQSARAAFERSAFARGVEVLLRSGPAAAHSWFALAAEAGGGDRLLTQQLYAMCRAAKDSDADRVEAIRAVIKRRPVPAALAPVME